MLSKKKHPVNTTFRDFHFSLPHISRGLLTHFPPVIAIAAPQSQFNPTRINTLLVHANLHTLTHIGEYMTGQL